VVGTFSTVRHDARLPVLSVDHPTRNNMSSERKQAAPARCQRCAGFRLAGFEPALFDPETAELLQADGIFLRK
jgi:hypothetical protein